MDIAFERIDWFAPPAKAGGEGEVACPEWHALVTRLWAGREAWQTLRRAAPGGGRLRLGSFDVAAAARVRELGLASEFVNQTDSANRNRAGVIFGAVAGPSSTGGRG